MPLKKCLWMISFAAITFLAGCLNNKNEVKDSKEIKANAIYFDYKIWGDEESGDITIKLQYRSGGAEGKAIGLKEPGNVEFDGEMLRKDSSRMNGVYYELSRPSKDFAGKHRIVYTNFEKNQYVEEFGFPVISLKKEMPETLNRKDLVFELDGLDTNDYVHIIFTDTFFYSRGIDKIDTIMNGRVTITQTELDNLRNGPVYLEIYKEEERSLKETSNKGGRLSLSYGLKRAFKLTN